MSAREVQMALRGRNDGAAGARHAGSKVLSDCASTVAETELLAADADHAAVVGAWSAVAVGGCGGVRGGRLLRSSTWGGLHGRSGRLRCGRGGLSSRSCNSDG
jgi:hypothetical protein